MDNKCAICGKPTSNKPYRIFYGKRGLSTTNRFGTERTTKYSFNPDPIEIALCNSSINKAISLKRIGGITLMVLGVLWLIGSLSIPFFAGSTQMDFIGVLLCALLPAILLGVVGYFRYFVVNEHDKVQLARKSAMAVLSKDGFDTFFTETEYRSRIPMPSLPTPPVTSGGKVAATDDEAWQWIGIIRSYGLSEVNYLDGSYRKAEDATLKLVGRTDPATMVALLRILSEITSSQRSFRSPIARAAAEGVRSAVEVLIKQNESMKKVVSDEGGSPQA